MTSVIPTPGTTRIVLDGLELGKSYRITLTGPGGKPPFERETITPTADSVARELAIAMERFEPYRHMVQLTSEHYRLWNAEQSKKTKEPRLETLPRDWEAKLAELSDKHHIMMRARTFARLSGVILGSDSVDPAHKRTIRDQGYDFRELEESADLLGMKHAPISGLVDSPLYGEIPQSLIAKPQGWVFTLKHPDEIATLYPGWEAFAKPLKIQDDGMHDRLRSMSDPREAKDVSMEGLLGNIYVAKAPVQLPPREQLARVELHAFIQGAATNLALDLRVSPKRVTSRRSWRRVAQLKPADDRPQHLVHSIPVDILGSDPFHILGELAYCRNWHLLAEALDQRLDVVFIALVYETR